MYFGGLLQFEFTEENSVFSSNITNETFVHVLCICTCSYVSLVLQLCFSEHAGNVKVLHTHSYESYG